jgi:hypothetical protein
MIRVFGAFSSPKAVNDLNFLQVAHRHAPSSAHWIAMKTLLSHG